MRKEAMLEMSEADLDAYARVLGIDVSAHKTAAAKAEAIDERRARSADIDVLGITMTVPIKRAHDKRVADILAKPLTDDKAEELLLLLLGEEQVGKLVERATDEDGTVDVDAMGLAIARLTTADALKNF